MTNKWLENCRKKPLERSNVLVRSDAPESEFAFVTEPKSVMEINACCEAMKDQGVEVLSMIRLSDL